MDKIENLTFTLPPAIEAYKKDLHTTDLAKIQKIIKLGIVREVVGINERNEARKYAA
jgi:hypothetical protein